MTDYAESRRVMVDTQVRPSDVTKYPIIEAMLTVPRELFVPAARREAAYLGENLDLGGGRVVLDPRTLAKMLDAMDLDPTDMVLDVGANLGYSSAVLARLAGTVVALEEEAAYASEAESALAETGADNVAVETGALVDGAPRHGPYDAIVVQGAVGDLPAGFSDQLKEGGRMGVIFMEGALGVCRIGHKVDGAVSWRYAFNASAPVLPGFETAASFAL